MAMAEPSNNLYVPRLPGGVSEEQVRSIFGSMAEVAQCKVLSNTSGECAALVRFNTTEDAAKVIEFVESVNGHIAGFDYPLLIRYADPPKWKDGKDGQQKGGYGKAQNAGGKSWSSGPYGGGGKGPKAEPEPSDNLYVTQLPGDTNVEELQHVFSQYGTVQDARITYQDQNHAAALVRFSSVQEAGEVKETLNGNLPQGMERCQEPIAVRFADAPKWKKQEEGWQQQDSGSWGLRPTKSGGSWGGAEQEAAAAGVADDGGWGGGKADAGGWGSTEKSSGGGGGNSKFSMKTVVKGFEASDALPGAATWNSEGGGQIALFVRGLPGDCEDADLYRIFACFGAIASRGVKVMLNPEGSCKGFGFVNFLDPIAADLAITALDGTLLPDGRTRLNVNYKKPSGRGASKGGSGGGCAPIGGVGDYGASPIGGCAPIGGGASNFSDFGCGSGSDFQQSLLPPLETVASAEDGEPPKRIPRRIPQTQGPQLMQLPTEDASGSWFGQ